MLIKHSNTFNQKQKRLWSYLFLTFKKLIILCLNVYLRRYFFSFWELYPIISLSVQHCLMIVEASFDFCLTDFCLSFDHYFISCWLSFTLRLIIVWLSFDVRWNSFVVEKARYSNTYTVGQVSKNILNKKNVSISIDNSIKVSDF